MFLRQASFVPHTLEHLTQARVFPSAIPKVAYEKMQAEYTAISDVEVSDITYENDSLAVTGLSAVPKSLATATHPLLIYNRGGSGEYGKLTLINVLRSMVPFARAGYLVFASNYRGNAGSEGKDEFGGKDVHDVLNLLAIARSHPAWDGKNAFMLGHSRGGMMTTLAIKQGAKLNAAISLAGISDAHALRLDTEFEERLLKVRIPDYSKNPHAALSARSAIDWPEKIKLPLLLIHGDADKDVGVLQSIRLNERLTQAHKLVIIPDGNHALYRHWNTVLAECFAWLKLYSL